MRQESLDRVLKAQDQLLWVAERQTILGKLDSSWRKSTPNRHGRVRGGSLLVNNDDPKVRYRTAMARVKIGNALLLLREYPNSIQQFGQAIEMLEKLVKAEDIVRNQAGLARGIEFAGDRQRVSQQLGCSRGSGCGS